MVCAKAADYVSSSSSVTVALHTPGSSIPHRSPVQQILRGHQAVRSREPGTTAALCARLGFAAHHFRSETTHEIFGWAHGDCHWPGAVRGGAELLLHRRTIQMTFLNGGTEITS